MLLKLGVRTSSDSLLLPSLALVAGINLHDLPPTAASWLWEADAAFGLCRGVSWSDTVATPRAWQLVEGDGSRTQVWRKTAKTGNSNDKEEEEERAAALLPPLLPSSSSSLSCPISIPRSVLENARAHHVGLDPLNPKHAPWLSSLREEVGTNTRVTAETFQECSARFPTRGELRSLLRPLDLFSPNEGEAASLVEGEAGRSAISAARSLLSVAAEEGEEVKGKGKNFLDAVVVRRGGLGAVLVSRSDSRVFNVPAVSGLALRDTTGCGNAFLGALAAAAAASCSKNPFSSSSFDDAALALGVASAAAAAVAEVLGTPALSVDLFDQPSKAQVERAAERALAVRGACVVEEE
mgnify:FL=1